MSASRSSSRSSNNLGIWREKPACARGQQRSFWNYFSASSSTNNATGIDDIITTFFCCRRTIYSFLIQNESILSSCAPVGTFYWSVGRVFVSVLQDKEFRPAMETTISIFRSSDHPKNENLRWSPTPNILL